MFCRRVATLTKRARAELEALSEAHLAMTERLIANYRAVLRAEDFDVREADVARLSPFVRQPMCWAGTPSSSPTCPGVCTRCASLGRASFSSRAGARSLASNFTFRMVKL